MIEDATLMVPLTEIDIGFNSSNFTNFVLIEHEVYFAVDNIIAVMNILDSTQTQICPESPAECTQIYELVSDSAECAESAGSFSLLFRHIFLLPSRLWRLV